jgi:hypothetical protein
MSAASEKVEGFRCHVEFASTSFGAPCAIHDHRRTDGATMFIALKITNTMMMHRFAVSCLYVLLSSSVLTVDAAEVSVAAVDALGNVETIQEVTAPPILDRPSSPFVELFGEKLIYLAPTSDGKSVQPQTISTTDALAGKSVVGVYFSADWCE